MLDIGWSEMAVIALVALIVIGPKELPQAMRAASKWVRKARSLAREFQSGVDDMIREADLEDARKAVQSAKSLNLDKALEETIDPTGEVGNEARDLDRAARSTDASTPSTDASTPSTDADTPSTDADTPSKDGASKGETPAERATVVEHPLKVAPAHSITPPADDAGPEKAEAEGKTKTA